jgi:hypothetical protein
LGHIDALLDVQQGDARLFGSLSDWGRVLFRKSLVAILHAREATYLRAIAQPAPSGAGQLADALAEGSRMSWKSVAHARCLDAGARFSFKVSCTYATHPCHLIFASGRGICYPLGF